MERVLHGVFLVIADTGVLLAGPPGCGKSRLGLELVARGHALVADDAPLFCRDGAGLAGRAAPGLAGVIHLRGLGAFDVAALYGPGAVRGRHALDLILRLDGVRPPDRAQALLRPATATAEVLGATVPVLHVDPELKAQPGVVEALVRRHALPAGAGAGGLPAPSAGGTGEGTGH